MSLNSEVSNQSLDFYKYDKENPGNLKPSTLNPQEQETLFNEVTKLLIDGKSFRQIALLLNIRLSTLYEFTNTSERSTRTKHALMMSATTHMELSISVLENAPSDKLELMRARELSSAHRWAAKVKDPRSYGEKVDVTSGNEKIIQISLGNGINPEQSNIIDITHEE